MQRIPDSEPDPETVYAERETLQVINEMLGKMKPPLRQAFTITYYNELSGLEACARLGISLGTFKARLFRARRYLASHAQHSLVGPHPKESTFLVSPLR
jgi:RNA polymerase sigma-70 factor (ECF subfamily)